MGEKQHSEFKSRMFKQSEETIKKMDAVLTLNFDKNNYIKILDFGNQKYLTNIKKSAII